MGVVSISVAAFFFGLVLAAGPARAAGPVHLETPSEREVERWLPEGGALDGRALYDRFLKNRRRLRTAYQQGRIVSSDPGGNPQEVRFWMHWKDYRDAADDPVNGLYSKALVKLSGPHEVRHSGYLYVHRSDRSDDQFMYSPNRGRTARVRVHGQSVAGTDFTFDDFLLTLDDVEDADYRRFSDEEIGGVPVYVVEATMKPSSESRYTRSISYLEQEHYVPLRTRYWDEIGVESKLLVSPHTGIREFDGVWVATVSTMTDILEDTDSTMYVDLLTPNPGLGDGVFSIAALEAKP